MKSTVETSNDSNHAATAWRLHVDDILGDFSRFHAGEMFGLSDILSMTKHLDL
jgi:hypothetical protein